jgi:heme/copper-type cytochrome/quinol oxidase subunit 2
MMLPFLLMFLGSQNWIENNAQGDHLSTAIWLVLALLAALVTISVSPVAAFVSTIVSAIRRRSVPEEYRQNGRNWQPLKSFVWISVAVATLGGAIGMLTHYQKLPRWDNWPMNMIEETLTLNRFAPYAQISASLKTAGFFVSPRSSSNIIPDTDSSVVNIQVNLKRLGYKVAVTGRMDDATRQAVVAYAKKRKLKTTEPQAVLTSMCNHMPSSCTRVSRGAF